MNYVTLYQVKKQMNLLNTTKDDTIFNDWIQWSCELIDYWKGRRFDVRKETIFLDTPVADNSIIELYLNRGQELYLNVSDYDLLEIIELLNGDESEILSSQYWLDPANKKFINRIKLRKGSDVSWLQNEDNGIERAIQLTAYFGFNRNYPNCFVDTLVELPDTLAADATEVSLSEIDSPAKDFLTPAIQVGNMLKIGDEFILVKSIEDGDYDDKIVGLERAYNGTEAVEHLDEETIFVYRPDGDIIQMALRLVQWRYRQKDQDVFDRTFNLATQSVTTPTSLPADVRMILGKRKALI